ncbi:glycosyl hydrolase family 95 catalytic domain-containing protein [Microbacterium karelineae]|uniref:glycosyl hydrolase family 95 catalytic domain-containing protein n=1 Tax=Microbacterium karelineae TaxID=2654283 RepID=UPI0012EA1D2E|nr:glycoside hydrolase N-terminal domain-containing protein [Microbacterium karelineae]
MHTDVTSVPYRRDRAPRGRSLVFAGAAAEWLEAMPLGNGRLGAMCGGGARAVIDLNEESVWSGAPGRDERQRPTSADEAQELLARARAAVLDGRPQDAEESLARRQSDYTQAFLPVGRLVIGGEDPDPPTVMRSLDLTTAVHEVRAGDLVAETFVSKPAQVLVHAISGDGADPALEFSSPLRETSREDLDDGFVVRLRAPVDVPPPHEPSLPAAVWPEPGEESVEVVVVVRRRTAPERTVVVAAIETTYAGASAPLADVADAERRARSRAETALRTPYERLREDHVRAHRALFDRVRLDLGRAPDRSTADRLADARASGDVAAADPDLVATLFDYGRYLLICSSRPGGLPAHLQGLWSAEMRPPWSSNYTLNINTEMNCWAAGVTDLPETVEPLLDFAEDLARRGADTARHDFGARGWVAHHNSDAWAFTAAVGRGQGDLRWAYWPFAGPWLACQLADLVDHAPRPPEQAARAAALLRGAAEFVLDLLIELPTGELGTAPSTSPENTFRTADGRETALGVTSTMDLALARDVLARVVRGSVDGDPLAREAAAALARLPELASRIDEDGVREWRDAVAEVDPHHRHVSHLYPVFPGSEADDAFTAAAARSLDRRGLDSTGWSLAWKTALWARIGRPDRVEALIRLMFRDARGATGHAGGLYPNLFAAHPPFQIDGNLGFVAGLAECLLQSHRGRIELLPALPPSLPSGRVQGLIARPGIRVGIAWSGGELVEARLRALPGAEGEVRIAWGGSEADVAARSDADTVVTPADLGGGSR